MPRDQMSLPGWSVAVRKRDLIAAPVRFSKLHARGGPGTTSAKEIKSKRISPVYLRAPDADRIHSFASIALDLGSSLPSRLYDTRGNDIKTLRRDLLTASSSYCFLVVCCFWLLALRFSYLHRTIKTFLGGLLPVTDASLVCVAPTQFSLIKTITSTCLPSPLPKHLNQLPATGTN